MTDAFVTVVRGAKLREIREEKGLTVRGVARASGVNYGTISRLEGSSGVRTTVAKLEAIALALGVPFARLKDAGNG